MKRSLFDYKKVEVEAIKTAKSESGAVFVLSMVVLVTLSLLGAFAIHMSNTEAMISMNHEVFTDTFYRVESIVVEPIARIEYLNQESRVNALRDPSDANYPKWLQQARESDIPGTDYLVLVDKTTIGPTQPILNRANWGAGNTQATDASFQASVIPAESGAVDQFLYAVHDKGRPPGEDLTSEVRAYEVYSLYDVQKEAAKNKNYVSRRVVEVGYKAELLVPEIL